MENGSKLPILNSACCSAVQERSAIPTPTLWRRFWLLGAVPVLLWWEIYSHLQALAGWITYSLLRLESGKRLSSTVEFFVFEAPKVLMLLVLVVFGVGVIRSFFTPQRTRAILAGKRESAGNVMAALLGVVTPFCSCSAVPLFIGFVTTGVPLGVTLSFPDFGANGERDCACFAVWSIWLAYRCDLCGNRPVDRDCRWLDNRTLENEALR